jgi:hypothetical protein
VAVSLRKPPHGGFSSETAVAKPFQKRNGYKFITAIKFNGHTPTDAGVRSGLTVMQRPWPPSKGNGPMLVWESLAGPTARRIGVLRSENIDNSGEWPIA